jgi:hypothetical protein
MVDGEISGNVLRVTSANYISILQVTDFFTTMNNHADFEDGFLHPDPDQATRLKDPGGSEKIENIVNFCEYSTVS